MPEYLAPGVYIEEVSYRAKTIEGVSTSTAGFVGPTRYGPIEGEPELLTSFADFERIYGGLDQLDFNGDVQHNFLAHAVRAFYEEGGKRLYVSRVFRSSALASGNTKGPPPYDEGRGYASAIITDLDSPPTNDLKLRSRYPGSGGNVDVTFTIRVGQNVLAGVPRDPNDLEGEQDPVLRGVSEYELLWISDLSSPVDSPPGLGTLYWAERTRDEDGDPSWEFHTEVAGPLTLTDLAPGSDNVRIVTVDVEIRYPGRNPRSETWEGLTFHPEHVESLNSVFAPNDELNNRLQRLTVPIVFESSIPDGVAIAHTLLGQPNSKTRQSILETLGVKEDQLQAGERQFTMELEDGNDGVRPEAGEYEGDDGSNNGQKSGLRAFEDLEDISIVAAPGYSFEALSDYQANTSQIMRHLISHTERMRYRIAVLDSPDESAISDIRSYRSQVDSKHAALYYPWVTILDPLNGEEANMPPSGFVSGIYARNDVEKGVQKAPANEVVRTAINFEYLLNKSQQDVLNPEGINCFRFFEGRGYRLWGARTISSDPEWKYVQLRRYFAYLERSIEIGTQWVVFESNAEPLWANVRRTVEDFLFNEWKSNRLMGTKPEEAYFVRCDRSTMTQNDIDNGRLICLVGVAPLRPAEFVIFRIGQWTADSKR
jgi:phage tail sheath protein FI